MTTDPTTPAPHDYRIMAISEALLEHSESWTTKTDDGIVFDTELAAVIAVAAIEMWNEERQVRACRHACHEAERDDNIRTIREWCDYTGQKQLGEEIVTMMMDEVE